MFRWVLMILCVVLGSACTPLTGDDDTGIEKCDGIDNNSDGTVDNLLTPVTYFFDGDGDGYGNTYSYTSIYSCECPLQYARVPGDCNDDHDKTYPLAAESPTHDGNGDGIDNSCDGVIDEGTLDGDDDKDGKTENQGDCNDADNTIFSGAVEVANGIDNDCDGSLEDDDGDGDGFAEDGAYYSYVTAEGETVTQYNYPYAGARDCNDADASIHPQESEPCVFDRVDNNCNDMVDEYFPYTESCNEYLVSYDDTGLADDAEFIQQWDFNNDGSVTGEDFDGDKDGLASHRILQGSIKTDGTYSYEYIYDCDDFNPDRRMRFDTEGKVTYGAEPTTCNSVDEDCDWWQADVGDTALQVTWGQCVAEYGDADGDGYLNGCDASGNCIPWEDCDDTDKEIHPNAAEMLGDGIDSDCGEVNSAAVREDIGCTVAQDWDDYNWNTWVYGGKFCTK